jgi:hypothetical protein
MPISDDEFYRLARDSRDQLIRRLGLGRRQIYLMKLVLFCMAVTVSVLLGIRLLLDRL